jgi:RNA polymerase sigma factor (sigma-70 family)
MDQRLIEELLPKLYGYFYRRCEKREDVDDLVMSCIESTLSAELDQPIDRINAYIWTVAKHTVYAYYKKRGKEIAITEVDDIPWSRSFEQQHHDLIEQAKQLLTPEKWQLWYAYVGEGESAEVLSVRFNIKANTIRQRCGRITRLLQNKLKIF